MSNSQNLSTPNHAWNPDMTYRQDRDRALGPTTNLLEDYADASIVTCWRTYKKHKQPNQRWGQEVDVAVKTSNTIDLIDSNERALDQVIWGITHPSDCHPGVKSIVENPALVDLLLIRHFKAHGGLVLPPLQAARELQEAHEIVAKEEMASGKTWCTGRTMMHYPNWRDTRKTTPPPGFTSTATRGGSAPSTRGGLMGLNHGGRGGGFCGRGPGRGGHGGAS